MTKIGFCFATIGALATLSTAAHAVTVGLAANETGYVDGRHVYIDPLTLDGKTWFCLSPDVDIALGKQPYVYSLASLTPADSSSVTGHTLSLAQIGEIGALVVKGSADVANHASSAQIAADASAIWSIEGATVTSDNAAVSPLITADLSWASGRSEKFITMTNTSGVQNVGGVPEPTSWALMIVGFGFAGAVMRRGRVLSKCLQSRSLYA